MSNEKSNITSTEQNSSSTPLTQEQITQKQLDFINKINFSRLSKEIVQDLVNSRKESVLFQRFTKEEVIKFLANPQACEKQIRDMSNFLYANSSHYRRLCNYFSKLLTMNYTIVPYNLPATYNKNSFLVNYRKVVNLVEKFNFKSLFLDILNTCMYQDIYCGLYFETSDSFDIVHVNADFCKIHSREDSCLVFSLNFDYFNDRLYLLDSYGEEIRNMYYNYRGYSEVDGDGKKKKIKGDAKLKWQEPPHQVCFKINSDQLLYSLPPFSAVFPEILNLEDYKLLKKAGEQLKNYKVLAMKIPLNDDKSFALEDEVIEKFYTQACNNIAAGVGLIVTPMDIEPFSFQNSATSESDAVVAAENELWSSTGSNGSLFGSGDKLSSSSLSISIKNDEAMSHAMLRQLENWINKYIKQLNLPYDFKVQYLNQSIYDETEVCDRYLKGATYGVAGSRILYAASLGLSPSDILNGGELEDALGFVDKWIPLKSSNTMSSNDEGGRPTQTTVDDSGESTREQDSNASK